MKLFLPLLLPVLHLSLLRSSLAEPCPRNCNCPDEVSIFCYNRKDPKMPDNVPKATRNVYVFKNGIESLSQEDFAYLVNLEMLDLSQNKLVEIPDHVFEPLHSLYNLDLSANQIVYLSEKSFAGLDQLERLYLYNNLIESIHPAAFNGLLQLLELKLQGNKLTTMAALKLPNLLLLDLGFNSIPSPGPDDLQTPRLEALKLGGIGFSSLNEELVGSLKNLHELDISNNQLTNFPQVLREARGLVILNLTGNPMGPVNWEDFENLTELHELDVSNLSLQGLPEVVTQLFPHLQRLTVAENPFNCLCSLAWFPRWLQEKQIQLGRTEETRCHFPPLNAGKVLGKLEHRDFGCPSTTTITTRTVKSTALAPALLTSRPSTTHAVVPAKPSHKPSTETDHLPPPTPSTSIDPDLRLTFCPSNICLNGGTCWLDHKGHLECICLPETSGSYCEIVELSMPSVIHPTAIVSTTPEITAEMVTSSSILLDLHRYISVRPHIRAVKLTYVNMSGPDKRPKNLNVPASYPEYTIRGLQPNSTYSVCASPLGEPEGVDTVCTEAQTVSKQLKWTAGEPLEDPKLPTMLIPAVAILLLLVLVAVAVGVACFMHRRKSKGHLDLECDPSQLELEGLENGALPQKQEIHPCTAPVQNGGLDYDVPLMHDNPFANNNTNCLKPSYF